MGSACARPEQYSCDEDREALKTFYQLMGGPSWTSAADSGLAGAGWGRADLDIRLWAGVRVAHGRTAADRRVVALKIANAPMTGPCSAIPTALSALRSLALNANFIKGPIPDSISCVGALEFLDLNTNSLTGGTFPAAPPPRRRARALRPDAAAAVAPPSAPAPANPTPPPPQASPTPCCP